MKIQTLLGKVMYQQDFIYFFNKVIADKKFKMAVQVLNCCILFLIMFRPQILTVL